MNSLAVNTVALPPINTLLVISSCLDDHLLTEHVCVDRVSALSVSVFGLRLKVTAGTVCPLCVFLNKILNIELGVIRKVRFTALQLSVGNRQKITE